MALSLNKPKLDNLAGDIWKSAERLRGKFKAYEYQGVILPIIVIRRLECVLLAWREAKSAEVLAKRPKLTQKELAKLVKELELNPKQSPFSNKTHWTLRKVYEEDHTLLEENFRAYINGFSKNVDDIIEHFNYRATIGTMVKNNRLAPILNQYKELELGPDQLSGLEMGYIYEELLRRFSEQSGEEAGEHFTPREVIRLMIELLEIPVPDRHISIYDPACGTGGMLSVAKEHMLDRAATPAQRDNVEKFVTVHGQELSPTNYAICQADLLIKNDQQAKVFFNTIRVPLSAAERGVMTEKTYDYYGASGVIDKVEAYLFDGTYILIAEDGANLLNRSKPLAFLATGKFWVNNHAHILKPRWGGDETFFVTLLESQDFSLFVTGAAQPKLTMENLGRFKLAVPRVAEQKEIAAFIREKDAEFRPLFAQIERQVETLVAYRKSLIHECVTGQRRVTTADMIRARREEAGASLPF